MFGSRRSSSPSRRRRVAVVGGGIAGLTLAASLDPRRWSVTVYEAQPERSTGAALGLWPGARRALGDLGVQLEVARDRALVVHRTDGRVLGRVPAPGVAQVMRPALMGALREAVPASVKVVAEPVLDPGLLDADVVVGADGVRSVVRGLVDRRAAERRSTPWVALRGVAPASLAGVDAGGVAREFWGNGRLFGDAAAPGGRYWFTAHRSELGPEPLDVGVVLDEARDVFAADASQILAELAAADVAGALATRLWVAPPMHRYVRGRFVVIGDAAHASLPNLGRGASDAIMDAVTLARTLNGDGSLDAWQARRLPVTQAARAGAGVVMRVATFGV